MSPIAKTALVLTLILQTALTAQAGVPAQRTKEAKAALALLIRESGDVKLFDEETGAPLGSFAKDLADLIIMSNDSSNFEAGVLTADCAVKLKTATQTIRECRVSHFDSSLFIHQDKSGALVAEQQQVGGGYNQWYTFSVLSEKKSNGKTVDSIVDKKVVRGIAG